MKRTTYYLFASAIALTTALPAFAQVAEQPPAAPADAPFGGLGNPFNEPEKAQAKKK